MIVTFPTAAMLLAIVQAAAPAPMTIRDPELLATQLTEMGYVPQPFAVNGMGVTTSTILTTGEAKLSLALGGCTLGRNCRYAVLLGSFNDVAKPPAKWVATQNAEFDAIEVWVGDDGILSYSAGAIVEGMPRESFKAWVDLVVESSDELATEAVKAKLAKD